MNHCVDQTACICPPKSGVAVKLGGASAGTFGGCSSGSCGLSGLTPCSRLAPEPTRELAVSNGVGPVYTSPTKSGRLLTLPLSLSPYSSPAAAASSPPAEKPTIPILCGSKPHCSAFCRTSWIAAWASITASEVML